MAKNSSTGVLLGLVALAGLAFASSASATPSSTSKTPAKPGPTPGPSPTPSPSPPSSCKLDDNIPPDVASGVRTAIASTSLSPADYEQLAVSADSSGFHLAAGCLRDAENAAKMRAQQELQTRGGMPFVIRQGDIPYLLAQYYTGVPGRFRELEPPNPQLGALTNMPSPVNPSLTISAYPGWIPGTEILIPKSWNPLDKPIPPTSVA